MQKINKGWLIFFCHKIQKTYDCASNVVFVMIVLSASGLNLFVYIGTVFFVVCILGLWTKLRLEKRFFFILTYNTLSPWVIII